MIDQSLDTFRQRIANEYMALLSPYLPPRYQFLDGTPVQAVLPRQTTPDSILILGAYPAARYETCDGEAYVPVGNIREPFDVEAKSGDELDRCYLNPLGLTRQQCWITNLVRCYLFEEQKGRGKRDITKYRKLGKAWPERAVRDSYDQLAQASLPFLADEMVLARPRLVITLGREVAAAFHPDLPRSKRTALVEDETLTWHRVKLGGQEWTVVHLAHPGIMMRNQAWRDRLKRQLASLKPDIQKLLQ